MKKQLLCTLLTASFLSVPAIAFAQEKLPSYDDGAYVMLTGTAQNVEDDSFELRHENGVIGVEMEDWGWEQDLSNYIVDGEQIVVSGTIDDDWFSDREIEANNVYVDDDSMYYYVYDVYPAYSNTAEESKNRTASTTDYEEGTYVTSRGTVQEVSAESFTMASNGQNMKVYVSKLSYDPLDGAGLSRGDRVFVSGEIDEGFFNDNEIEADVVVMTNEVTRKQQMTSKN